MLETLAMQHIEESCLGEKHGGPLWQRPDTNSGLNTEHTCLFDVIRPKLEATGINDALAGWHAACFMVNA